MIDDNNNNKYKDVYYKIGLEGIVSVAVRAELQAK